jgi:hypothetical protein
MKIKIKDMTTPFEGEIAQENGRLVVFTRGKWVEWREPCPITPVRVKMRLPEAWETDSEGRCWCAAERPCPDDPIRKWELRKVRCDDCYFPQDEFWLPYNALPPNG